MALEAELAKRAAALPKQSSRDLPAAALVGGPRAAAARAQRSLTAMRDALQALRDTIGYLEPGAEMTGSSATGMTGAADSVVGAAGLPGVLGGAGASGVLASALVAADVAADSTATGTPGAALSGMQGASATPHALSRSVAALELWLLLPGSHYTSGIIFQVDALMPTSKRHRAKPSRRSGRSQDAADAGGAAVAGSGALTSAAGGLPGAAEESRKRVRLAFGGRYDDLVQELRGPGGQLAGDDAAAQLNANQTAAVGVRLRLNKVSFVVRAREKVRYPCWPAAPLHATCSMTIHLSRPPLQANAEASRSSARSVPPSPAAARTTVDGLVCSVGAQQAVSDLALVGLRLRVASVLWAAGLKVGHAGRAACKRMSAG